MPTATATTVEPRLYANYWEDDHTANPCIVRLGERHGDFFDVTLPDGTEKQVNLHTLGKGHRL